MGSISTPTNDPLLLLCHGKLHETRLPRHMIDSIEVDWAKAVTLDMNSLSLPDVSASMLDKAVVALIPAGSIGLMVPVYCDSEVYGSWNAPNPVFFRAAVRWLRSGGHVVVVLPSNALHDRKTEERIRSAQEVTETLFEARLPPSLKQHEVWPVIEALDRAKTSADRKVVFESLSTRFPPSRPAITWLRRRYAHIPFHASTKEKKKPKKAATRRPSDAAKRAEFANRVSIMTAGNLIRVTGAALVKKGSGAIVFRRHGK